MTEDESVIGTVALSCGSVISVADGIGSSVMVATDVGSEVTISVGLEDGMSVMVVPGSAVDGKESEVTGCEVNGSLETSGVLPGGDMVGEASDVETGGCVLTFEFDSVEAKVDRSSEGVVKEGNTVGSGVVVSDGVKKLSGMEEITLVPGFASDGVKELSGSGVTAVFAVVAEVAGELCGWEVVSGSCDIAPGVLERRRAEVASCSVVVVTGGSPELSGRSEEGTGSVVLDTIPGMITSSVEEEEDGTEVWLSLGTEREMETDPVVLVEIIGLENTDSVVGMLVTSVTEVSTGNGTTAVELVPSRMLVTMSVSDGSKMVEDAPVVPGPVMPSRVEVGVSMTENSSPPAVLVGMGVLVGSSSAAVEVSMAVEETPVPLPVIPDSVSVAALVISLGSISRVVEAGSSEEVRIPDGAKVISLSVLVSSSLLLEEEDLDAASEVVSVDDSDVESVDGFSSELELELELEKMEDSELDSASDVVEVELGRMTTSGSPRVAPISSSSSEVVTVEEVGIGAGKSVDVFPSSMTIVLETTTVFTTVGGWDTGSKSDATSVSKSVVLKDEVVVGRVLFRTWRLTCFGK